jgi:hypothetical protein
VQLQVDFQGEDSLWCQVVGGDQEQVRSVALIR